MLRPERFIPQQLLELEITTCCSASSFSACTRGSYALRFLREGAHGYMNKERAGDELIGALRTVHAGRRCVSRALPDKLAASR